MSKKDSELDIAPDILRKLRENTGYSEQQISSKLEISVEELQKIESGKVKVSIGLIKRLSDIYQYPLITFFEDKAPEYPHKLKDYRINRDKKISPEVRKAERRAYYLINALQEISEERSNIPEFSKDYTATQLAQAFREKIGISTFDSKKPEETLENYKQRLENKTGIVVIEYPLKADDVRAFCISSGISIIVLNEKDKPEVKLFSLFHDMCHLIQRSSAICSMDLEVGGNNDVEYYCNLFASEVLVPVSDLRNTASQIGTSQKSVGEMSKKYSVSKQVIMIRLLTNALIQQERYAAFKSAFNEKLLPSEKKFGRRNWEKVYLKRVGRRTVEKVKSAHSSGKISTSEAMDILNIKSKYAEKFIGEGGYNGTD